jgi:hypothetical protein
MAVPAAAGAAAAGAASSGKTSSLLSGIIGAGGGIAGGIGTALQARELFTKEQKAELARLKRLRAKGGLGVSEREEAGIRAEGSGRTAAIQQGLQADALQRASASTSGAGGATSGREIFLQEQASQSAVAQAEGEANREIRAVDQARRQEQQARISELQSAKSARKAGIIGGVTQAVSAGLLAGGAAAGQQAQFNQQLEVAKVRAPVLSNDQLLRSLQGTAAPANPYGSRIPATGAL